MDSQRDGAVLCGAVVLFASDCDPSLATRVRAAGGEVRTAMGADVTDVVRDDRSEALAALLGATPIERAVQSARATGQRVRVWSEGEFAAHLAARVHTPREAGASAPVAMPTPPAAFATAADLERALREALLRTDSDACVQIAAALCDPRLVDAALASEGVRAVESRANGVAVGVLADVVRARTGVALAAASALGRLVARGVTRWGQRSPMAIEVVEVRGQPVGPELHALLDRAGATERLVDERGATVHRVIALAPPRAGDPFFALLAAISARRTTRVWLGGEAFPADLPATVWAAMFGPLGAR